MKIIWWVRASWVHDISCMMGAWGFVKTILFLLNFEIFYNKTSFLKREVEH